jgi:hypothetical protein
MYITPLLMIIHSLLLNWDFVHTLLMATALEGGCEELIHNLTSHVVVDETTWHHKNVSIVVLTDKMCNLRNPAQSGTHLLMLVQGDRYTLARTADSDAGIHLATLNTLSKSMTEVGIVYRGIAPGAIVLYRITFLLKILENELL